MAELAGSAEHQSETRWLLVLVGVICAVAGVIVLAEPESSLRTLAVVTGIFLLVDGIIETVLSVFGPGDLGGFLAVVLAIATAIVGVLLIRHPIHGVAAVALLFGLWLIVSSLIRFASALGASRQRGWEMTLAAIELVAGVVIVSSPDIGVRTLALLVGISLIVRGLTLCAVGWLLPRFLREVGERPHGASGVLTPR